MPRLTTARTETAISPAQRMLAVPFDTWLAITGGSWSTATRLPGEQVLSTSPASATRRPRLRTQARR
ncbi:hypothetical protein ACMATS_05890 [Streptoverticillium reticulum]|uniref:hypothetical protein n=1 Tax=Streptoverticillium reticulum TaxID=1433415 RepID=UPI0039BF34C2